jgi:hypothetical protein
MREVNSGEAGWHGEANTRPLSSDQVAHRRDRPLDFLDQRHDSLAHRRQPKTLRTAVDERDAERLLERREAAADGRVLDTHRT